MKKAELGAAALILLAAGCAGGSEPAAAGAGCADVVAAEIAVQGNGFEVSATVSSADTGWDKYADTWVVRTPGGEILGTRRLTHPHVDEQPFTRTLGGVQIPEGIDRVEIAAGDSVVGFCGDAVVIAVP